MRGGPLTPSIPAKCSPFLRFLFPLCSPVPGRRGTAIALDERRISLLFQPVPTFSATFPDTLNTASLPYTYSTFPFV